MAVDVRENMPLGVRDDSSVKEMTIRMISSVALYTRGHDKINMNDHRNKYNFDTNVNKACIKHTVFIIILALVSKFYIVKTFH